MLPNTPPLYTHGFAPTPFPCPSSPFQVCHPGFPPRPTSSRVRWCGSVQGHARVVPGCNTRSFPPRGEATAETQLLCLLGMVVGQEGGSGDRLVSAIRFCALAWVGLFRARLSCETGVWWLRCLLKRASSRAGCSALYSSLPCCRLWPAIVAGATAACAD